MTKSKKFIKRIIRAFTNLILIPAGFILSIWFFLSVVNFVFHDPLAPNIWNWNFFKVIVSLYS